MRSVRGVSTAVQSYGEVLDLRYAAIATAKPCDKQPRVHSLALTPLWRVIQHLAESSHNTFLEFAKNDKLEQTLPEASNNNNKLALFFVAIDEELKRLAKMEDVKEVQQCIPNIQNQLFELCNLSLYRLNINEFACNKPVDETSLNSECA